MKTTTARHWQNVEAQQRRMGAVAPDVRWAQEQVSPLPVAWARRLMDVWRGRYSANSAAANLKHLKTCKTIEQAQRAGVRADANNAELCDEAEKSARDAARRIELAAQAAHIGGREPTALVLLTSKLWALGDWFSARGLADAWERLSKGSKLGSAVLARACCVRTWRRILKRLHARAVEGTARTLGLVHKRAGLYVSDGTLKNRRGQLARNAAVLQGVVAVNEHDQEFALAELAAKGPANREIRRMELMTRIAGFEYIARQCNHDAYFVTVTCPSRMHAYRTKQGGYGVEENPKFDGTKPKDAQAYLADQWGRMRSTATRWGLDMYGFRIAEPNHDGTPHWHMLVFFPREVSRGELKKNKWTGRPVSYRLMVKLLRRYFWRTENGVTVDGKFRPDWRERGAKQKRIKIEKIDWTKGSAAGYVAKYVAKNIDGYKVEKDLYGNDTLTSSQRVDAWASTWNIRQFQQIGGAPVGVWREVRRLHPEQGSAAQAVLFALDAVNVSRSVPKDAGEEVERYTAATGFAAYVELQGGVRVRRRDLRIKLLREQTGELGRYGEVLAPRVVGIETIDVRRTETPAFGLVKSMVTTRAVRVEVESERSSWVIVDGARERVPGADDAWHTKEGSRARIDAAKRRALALGEAVRPWSPVNNCTRPALFDHHPVALFGHAVERTPKRGRWHHWKSRNGGVHTKESHDPDRKNTPATAD